MDIKLVAVGVAGGIGWLIVFLQRRRLAGEAELRRMFIDRESVNNAFFEIAGRMHDVHRRMTESAERRELRREARKTVINSIREHRGQSPIESVPVWPADDNSTFEEEFDTLMKQFVRMQKLARRFSFRVPRQWWEPLPLDRDDPARYA